MLAQVKTVQQAFAVARINAIKGGQPVAVSIQNINGVPTLVAWVDADGQQDFDNGTERVVGRWTIRTAFTVSEDPTLRFHNLGGVGGPNGALFLPTGAALVAEGGTAGVGEAGMIISDIKGNQLRLRIQAGTGSVIQEMRIPDTSDWDARASRYWRY